MSVDISISGDVSDKITASFGVSVKFLNDLKKFLSTLIAGKQFPKILIIGGGELGLMVAKEAYEKGLKVRVVIDREEGTPILWLEKYVKPLITYPSKRILRGKDYHEENYQRYPVLFYLPTESDKKIAGINFDDSDSRSLIKDYIIYEKPDFVLLEDSFISCDHWEILIEDVTKEVKEKQIIFVPDIHFTKGEKKFQKSDIFLSKIKFKEYIDFIGLNYVNEYLVIDNFEKLRENLRVKTKRNDLGEIVNIEEIDFKDFKKIKKFLQENNGKILLKPEMTSSGHGHEIIEDIGVIYNKIEDSYKSQQHRLVNRKIIFEKYISCHREFCVFASKIGNNESTVFDPITYKKYEYDPNILQDSEELLKEGFTEKIFKGQSRLRSSFSKKPDRRSITRKLKKITRDLIDNLDVPFLYVEFFVVPNNNENGQKEDILINEITYRPDDAGFISIISQKHSQFEIFVNSLMQTKFTQSENIGEDEEEFKVKEENSKEEFECYSLVCLEKFSFFPNKPYYKMSLGNEIVQRMNF